MYDMVGFNVLLDTL